MTKVCSECELLLATTIDYETKVPRCLPCSVKVVTGNIKRARRARRKRMKKLWKELHND